jgi:hypothetical protein
MVGFQIITINRGVESIPRKLTHGPRTLYRYVFYLIEKDAVSDKSVKLSNDFVDLLSFRRLTFLIAGY